MTGLPRIIRQRAIKHRLYPTPEQAEKLGQFVGVTRLVYNLALEQRRDHWRAIRRATCRAVSYEFQNKELTALRAEFDFIAAVPNAPQQEALQDLHKAFQRFFRGLGGYPTPRRKFVNDTIARVRGGGWLDPGEGQSRPCARGSARDACPSV